MKTKQILQKQIQQLELQIKKLSYDGFENEIADSLCNSLILKKAVLKKELQNLSKNPLLEYFKKVVPRKEKLICDYFN